MASFFVELEIEGAKFVLSYIQANKDKFEQELAPFVKDGEVEIVALAKKVNPWVALAVEAAVKYLGPNVPKYEGDAVAWIEAALEAFIAKG
jgi:hypothetical protein